MLCLYTASRSLVDETRVPVLDWELGREREGGKKGGWEGGRERRER